MQVCLPPSQWPASVTLRGPASSTGEGPPPPLESVCSALCHPTPRVKDSVKTRLQSPSWHLTPTPSGVGTLFCLLMRPGRNGGGQHLAGNTVPHGRSRSQGCGSQDPPGQVRTQGVWGPSQDSSPRPPPPTHTQDAHFQLSRSSSPSLLALSLEIAQPACRASAQAGTPHSPGPSPCRLTGFVSRCGAPVIRALCPGTSHYAALLVFPFSPAVSGRPPAAAGNTAVLEAEPTLSRSSPSAPWSVSSTLSLQSQLHPTVTPAPRPLPCAG